MRTKCHSRALRRKQERGNVLAYTVLSALFLFLAVGLGVDLSHLYLAKTELQNAADAAALAGASALTLPNPERITKAVDRAVDTMNLNKYNFDNKQFSAVMTTTAQRDLVTFAVNLSGPYVSEAAATADPDDIRFIRVSTPTIGVSMFFAIPILGTSQNLNAKATSGLSKPGNVRYCPAPLSAVQCNPTDSSCIFQSGFWGNCGDAPISGSNPPRPPVHTYPDGSTCDPTRTFCKGCTYTVRSAGSGGPAPGNLGLLGCAGSGCDRVRDALKAYGVQCNCGPASTGDNMATQTGECAGPVSDGLNVRFDVYQSGGGPMSYSPDFPPDTNIAQGTPSGNGANTTWPGINYAQYQAGSPFLGPATGHVGVDGRRVLVLPLTYSNEWPTGQSGTVPARGFGAFFMQNQAIGTNGDIRLEYVGENVTGITGIDPSGTSTSNIVTPVLYR
jgi:Flp pilus assembly protein TadG